MAHLLDGNRMVRSLLLIGRRAGRLPCHYSRDLGLHPLRYPLQCLRQSLALCPLERVLDFGLHVDRLVVARTLSEQLRHLRHGLDHLVEARLQPRSVAGL